MKRDLQFVEFRIKLNEGQWNDFATQCKEIGEQKYTRCMNEVVAWWMILKCSNYRKEKWIKVEVTIYAYVMCGDFILANQIVEIEIIKPKKRADDVNFFLFYFYECEC